MGNTVCNLTVLCIPGLIHVLCGQVTKIKYKLLTKSRKTECNNLEKMCDEYQEEEGLTQEQKRFLEECYLEFSERFTDSDLEYKKVYDSGIPSPPIMCPWYGRSRFNNRDRAGGSRNDHYRRRQFNNYQDRDRERRSSDHYHGKRPRYRDQLFHPY